MWTLLSLTLLTFIGHDFLAALPYGGFDSASPLTRGYLAFTNLAAAVWAMWLYAALRPAFGEGMRTAAIAAVAWWLIHWLQSSKVAALGHVALESYLPLAGAMLVAMVAAVACGAWLYEHFGARGSSA